MEKVQRLDGNGLKGLRYSLLLHESVSKHKGYLAAPSHRETSQNSKFHVVKDSLMALKHIYISKYRILIPPVGM